MDFRGARIGLTVADEQRIFLMVGLLRDHPGDDMTLRVVRARPPPGNDRIENATELSLPFEGQVDTFWASGEGDPSNDPDCPQVDNTVWYRFTAPKVMRIEFAAIAGPAGQALAYTGSLDALTQVACGEEEVGGGVVHVNLNAGETAFFAACCGHDGTASISARRIPLEQAGNDDFGSARPIGRRFSELVKTTGATSESADPDCRGAGHSVWYRFVAPFDMRAEASTGGSAYDTVLGVYEVQEGELRELACRDDELPPDPSEEFGSPSERVRFQAEEGHIYRFMVATTAEPSILQFRLREHIRVTIDPEATQLPDGLAEIHGVLHCTQELEGFGFGTVTQELDSGRVIEGVFNASRKCHAARRFTARVFPLNGRFRSGELHVELTWVFHLRPGPRYSVTEVAAGVQLP
ncbi:MAG: hypothetical protein WEA10_07920 [Actinomycetota bacterium]